MRVIATRENVFMCACEADTFITHTPLWHGERTDICQPITFLKVKMLQLEQ